jgi:hypothetical protein
MGASVITRTRGPFGGTVHRSSSVSPGYGYFPRTIMARTGGAGNEPRVEVPRRIEEEKPWPT